MASWSPPLEPDEQNAWLSRWAQGDADAIVAGDYDPYAEQDKTPTERMYDEMNREERPDGLA